jgi:hypothetical protein
MDRRLDWIARNGAFAATLCLATIGGFGWLQPVIAGFVWWTLAIRLWALPEGASSRLIAATVVSLGSAMTFDLAVLASMFVGQWYWTAFAYATSCGCFALAKPRATGKS